MRWIRLISLLFCPLAVGCSAVKQKPSKPVQAVHAQADIPEEQLLDVGIEIFSPGDVTEEDEEEGTYPEIRQAESRFIPFHVKQTLQNTAQWGAVRVIPIETDTVDVFVKGEIIESNGQSLVLKVEVEDASGRPWFDKTYDAEANAASYQRTQKGTQDAYQNLYNTIANDMVEYRNQLSTDDIRNIRHISELRFASNLVPVASDGYLHTDHNRIYAVNRLPADDDPMMARVFKLREREYMLVDTLNEYYADYYDEMWEPYQEWRKANRVETEALREVRNSSRLRKALGIAAVAAAIPLAMIDRGALLMILAGMYAYKSGMDRDKDVEIHVEAIRELGISYESEVAPMVVEVEGQTLKLTGSAEDQYRQWRTLMQEIYVSETGFAVTGEAAEDAVAGESVAPGSEKPSAVVQPRYGRSDQGSTTH